MVDVVITGIGQSQVGRRLSPSGLALTVEAATEAMADAGLAPRDIDGLSTFPGYTPQFPGFSPVSLFRVKDALGLQLDWFCGGLELPGQIGGLINAYAAIKAGLVRHVICFRTLKEGSIGATHQAARGRQERVRFGGDTQFQAPFAGTSYSGYFAMAAQRHFDLYGTTRVQLGQVAIVERRNAARNPKAVYTAPMSLEDYLEARMISTPLCLFDCDPPVDVSTVIILSAADAARDLKSRPIRIEAVGGGVHGAADWDSLELGRDALYDSAQRMWSRSDFKPKDVDIGLLYDGFSFTVLCWLEALGFCGTGESGAFVEGGHRISHDGELPINPHGGQLSGGRTHGFGFAHEAVVQLRGQGGARQVDGDLRLAVLTMGGGYMAGCMLLAAD